MYRASHGHESEITRMKMKKRKREREGMERWRLKIVWFSGRLGVPFLPVHRLPLACFLCAFHSYVFHTRHMTHMRHEKEGVREKEKNGGGESSRRRHDQKERLLSLSFSSFSFFLSFSLILFLPFFCRATAACRRQA